MERLRVVVDIEQEVSNVVKTTSSGIDSPTIQQRKVKTSVVVNDSESLALGGLQQNKRTTSKDQIPVLGELPLLPAHLYTGLAAADIEALLHDADEQWKAYIATYLTSDEQVLVKQYADHNQKFRDEAITPALAALRAGPARSAGAGTGTA